MHSWAFEQTPTQLGSQSNWQPDYLAEKKERRRRDRLTGDGLKETERQRANQAILQTDRKASTPTDRQIDRQTDRCIDDDQKNTNTTNTNKYNLYLPSAEFIARVFLRPSKQLTEIIQAEHKMLRFPTGRRQASWLFTRMAEDPNLWLPRNKSR